MRKICFLLLFLLCVVWFEARADSLSQPGKTDQNARIAELEDKIEELNRKLSDLEIQFMTIKERLDLISSLEISGFFDVSVSNYRNKPDIFAIGNFELDLKHSYENNFQVAAALVFDDELGTYLGVGFIDYSLYGDAAAARGRLFVEKGLHIQVGRFDVPLGNDWNRVSAVDRITITPPLTTEYLMEGVYNDVGLRFLINLMAFNLSVYSTHGVDKQHSYGGNTFGLRFGLTPFSNPYSLKQESILVFELGLSYLYDVDRSGEQSDIIYAIDYESKIGPVLLRSEYYNRDKTAGVVFDGYHITTGLDLKEILTSPVIIFLRYDYHREINNVIASFTQAYSGDIERTDILSRGTIGANINISNISYLKIEYQSFIESSERFTSHDYFTKYLYYAQLVITF